MLVESIIDAYKSKALSLNEKKALLSLFKPLTTSLKAFDPTVVQETYDVALTFLSQVADVWKSGTLFNSGKYESEVGLFQKSRVEKGKSRVHSWGRIA